jgi:acetyl-CoA synthetase
MSKINWSLVEREYGISSGKLNLFELIEKNALRNPGRPAICFQAGEEKMIRISYGKLVEKVGRLASLLKNNGVRKGERVMFFLPKCTELYIGILATIKLGAIAVPLFEAFQSDGLKLRISKGRAGYLVLNRELLARYRKIKNKVNLKRIFIVDSSDFRKKLQASPEECGTVSVSRTDPCVMMFTSSTAGTPVAGVLIPHTGVVQWIYTGRKILGLGFGTKYFCSAHPAWVTGMIYGVIAPLLAGSTVYNIDGRFDAKRWKSFIIGNKISHIYSAPTVFRFLLDSVSRKDLKTVKRVCSVGEALPLAVSEAYLKKGVKIIDTYWQTEIGAIVIANFPFRKGALGKAIGVDAFVKNEEIVLRDSWPARMVGILMHKKMFESYFDGRNFRTKDSAVLRKGYFYFLGRKDDIIKSSGERISPLEIENALIKHRSVKECAVVGIPDKLRGSIIKAIIVLKKRVPPSEKLKEELSEFVRKNYAGHAYPKIIEFWESLPKNNAGKVSRMAVKKIMRGDK